MDKPTHILSFEDIERAEEAEGHDLEPGIDFSVLPLWKGEDGRFSSTIPVTMIPELIAFLSRQLMNERSVDVFVEADDDDVFNWAEVEKLNTKE